MAVPKVENPIVIVPLAVTALAAEKPEKSNTTPLLKPAPYNETGFATWFASVMVDAVHEVPEQV